MRVGFESIYGVDNPFKLQEFQNVAALTRKDKYGAEYTLQHGSVLEEAARVKINEKARTDETKLRREETMLRLYGVRYASQSEVCLANSRATCLDRYGVEHWSKLPEVRLAMSERVRANAVVWRRKAEATCLNKYGVTNWMQTAEARQMMREYALADLDAHMARFRQGMINAYGVPYNMQRPEMRVWLSNFMRQHRFEFDAKSRKTSLNKYGVEYWTQTTEARERMRNFMRIHAHEIAEKKRLNGTLNTSRGEVMLYHMLVEKFGFDDVFTEYDLDLRYPFRCDFYIKSRDMFIELNAHWSHGCHWYGSGRGDVALSEAWSQGSDGYRAAFDVWTVRDVMKREVARQSNLNYVVFWSSCLTDVGLWFATGCPDSRDWAVEYEWMPRRFIPGCSVWNEDAGCKIGRLQYYVFSLFYKYFGLLPHMLTDLALLNRISDMGLFNLMNIGMEAV